MKKFVEMKEGTRQFRLAPGAQVSRDAANLLEARIPMINLPMDLSLEPNPRQSFFRKEIEKTLLEQGEKMGRLHAGLQISAKSAVLDEKTNTLNVIFRKIDGVFNGGSGYVTWQHCFTETKCVLDLLRSNPNSNKEELAKAEAQMASLLKAEIRLEIFVGLSEQEIREVSRARNDVKKVSTISLLNASGVLNPLMNSLPPETLDRIEWFQNQKSISEEEIDIKASHLLRMVVVAAKSSDPDFGPQQVYGSPKSLSEEISNNYTSKAYLDVYPHADRLLRLWDETNVLMSKHLRKGGTPHRSMVAKKVSLPFGKEVSFHIHDAHLFPLFSAIVRTCYEEGQWVINPESFIKKCGGDLVKVALKHIKDCHDASPGSYGKLGSPYDTLYGRAHTLAKKMR